MSQFVWTSTGNYPAGPNLWNGQPLAAPPAQTYFTPSPQSNPLKIPAENWNNILGQIAGNIATLDTNTGPYRLAAFYSGSQGLGPGFDGSPWAQTSVTSDAAYTTLLRTSGGTPPVSQNFTGPFNPTDYVDICWQGSVCAYQGGGNGFTGNNVELCLTASIGSGTLTPFSFGGDVLVPAYFYGSGGAGDEAPCIPFNLRVTALVSSLVGGSAAGALNLGLSGILQSGGAVAQRVSLYGASWIQVIQYAANGPL